jgi:hypothetical protein
MAPAMGPSTHPIKPKTPWFMGNDPPDAMTTENGINANAVTTAAKTTMYAIGAPSIDAPPTFFTSRSLPFGCTDILTLLFNICLGVFDQRQIFFFHLLEI